MQFTDKLVTGRLVRRYKRFLADVEFDDGTIVTAHCGNPGAMTGLNMPGLEVWLSPKPKPDRKARLALGAGACRWPSDRHQHGAAQRNC